MARKVGLKINRAKTEFMMVENWASHIELRVSTGTANKSTSQRPLQANTQKVKRRRRYDAIRVARSKEVVLLTS
jgi:hypothetical protein